MGADPGYQTTKPQVREVLAIPVWILRRVVKRKSRIWQIWYVFHRDGSAACHGRPNPWLSASSPDGLRKLISQANTQTDEDAAAGALKGDASTDASGMADVTECS